MMASSGKKVIATIVTALFAFLTVVSIFRSPALQHTHAPAKKDAAASTAAALPPRGTNDEMTVLVTRVIDGDTIEIEGGAHVRYIGMDTPETVDPRMPIQCFGLEASAKNKELVEGKTVRLEKDVSETDHYGRRLYYVFVGDTMVNLLLVKEGYAHAATFPPDVKYHRQFLEAEREAREQKRGLWASCLIHPSHQ